MLGDTSRDPWEFGYEELCLNENIKIHEKTTLPSPTYIFGHFFLKIPVKSRY